MKGLKAQHAWRRPAIKTWLFALGLGFSLTFVPPAHGAPVGDIQVCYNCSNSFGPGILDGPFFVIQDTSATDITNGVLSGPGDSFSVGTVSAGGQVIVIPGVSNDGGSHPAGGFFRTTGSILDTSDVGPDDNSTQFEFTGLQGSSNIDTGVFTPAATAGPSNDGNAPTLNPLGGPNGADGPCNNCFGPKIVADLNVVSAVPEPATVLLVGGGLAGLLGGHRRRR